MFKIQNFFNRSRYFLSQIQILRRLPRKGSKNESPSRPSLRNILIFPTTYSLGINLLSMNGLKFEAKDMTELVVETRPAKADTKEDVNELMAHITTEIREENLDNAKMYIDEAIRICERSNFIEFLPQLYDLLALINLREGNNELAEETLVRAIEKLIEIGYHETANEVVRFELILARLYQSKGDSAMAGLGFRNCIVIQETKFNGSGGMDEETSALYLSLLFWYGIFLSEQDELIDSKNYMEKALKFSETTSNEATRNIIILHYLAELSFRLKEFDDAIKYLVDGLRLCLQNLSLDTAMPVFMVKLGLVYLVKGMRETAGYWCAIARTFAKSSNNTCVENEASACLKYLRDEKTRDE